MTKQDTGRSESAATTNHLSTLAAAYRDGIINLCKGRMSLRSARQAERIYEDALRLAGHSVREGLAEAKADAVLLLSAHYRCQAA